MIVFRILLVFVFLLHFSCLKSQHTVFLIGDAGEDSKPGKALLTLRSHLEKESNSTVVFLGDNAYPQGVNVKQLDTLKRPYLHKDAIKLYAQLQILKNYLGEVYFVAGNHDWKAQKKRNSFQSIRNESKVINEYLRDSTRIKNRDEEHFIGGKMSDSLFFYSTDIAENICLIMFDSQFFLQNFKGISRKDKVEQMEKFGHQLFSFVREKSLKGFKIIIASHHPLFTNGNHSKFREPLRFLFNYTPFYFLGKLGIDRWLSQDIEQPLYKQFRKILLKYLVDFKDVFYVAGHDHNLQYITQTDDHHIVSGAGSKLKKLRAKSRFKNEFMNDQYEGFAKLVFDEKSGVELQFVSDKNEILFSKKIN